MNTVTATLCGKPVLGVAMWLMTLCVSNQALNDQFVDLGEAGVVLSVPFNAPMDETYRLLLVLRHADSSSATQRLDLKGQICTEGDSGAGAVTPLNITFRVVDPGGKPGTSQTYQPVCEGVTWSNGDTLLLGSLDIKKGTHQAELVNNLAMPKLAGKPVQVLLVGKGAGFP